jgi:hypothetical protein
MGFFNDTKEVRRLIQKNLDAGHGSQSLQKAVDEQKVLQAARAEELPKPKPHRLHGRTALISFLFGIFWSGSRRRW